MPAVRIAAAAGLLGVGASTLRDWEARHGFPAPVRTAGGHRQYDLAEVEALRDALRDVGDVGAAVEVARRRGAGAERADDALAALGSFDATACDRLAEASLALRGMERTVEEVLLAGVAGLDPGSPEHGFAARWATGWLAAQARTAPPATREDGVLLVDASAGAQDATGDALHVQALELLLRRAGLRVLVLPAATDPARIGRAVAVLRPRLVVLGGRAAALDGLARLVWSARVAAGEPVAVAEFRGALRGRDGIGASALPSLGQQPIAACAAARALLADGVRAARVPSRRVASG